MVLFQHHQNQNASVLTLVCAAKPIDQLAPYRSSYRQLVATSLHWKCYNPFKNIEAVIAVMFLFR